MSLFIATWSLALSTPTPTAALHEQLEGPDETWHVDISVREGEAGLDDAQLREIETLCLEYEGWGRPSICEDYGFEPESSDRWMRDGAYFMMGMAPAATFVPGSFHPQLRYDLEAGFSWQHPKKMRMVAVGVDGHIFHLFDRKRPGGGADVVLSGAVGPVYMRGGLGVLGGLPYGLDPSQTRPAVGGLVGVGLQLRGPETGGRVGVDYDLRVDRQLGVMHTVLLSVRFAWGF